MIIKDDRRYWLQDACVSSRIMLIWDNVFVEWHQMIVFFSIDKREMLFTNFLTDFDLGLNYNMMRFVFIVAVSCFFTFTAAKNIANVVKKGMYSLHVQHVFQLKWDTFVVFWYYWIIQFELLENVFFYFEFFFVTCKIIDLPICICQFRSIAR